MKRYGVIVSGLITLTLIGCSWQQDTDHQNIPPPPVTIKPLKPPISESETETAPPPGGGKGAAIAKNASVQLGSQYRTSG
ncbi:hypothetical protein Rin_00003680 [Candidatus Regiella insecticola 5.15]|uniref:Lipoprotein n=1 Tax=Candidatus Regiella insecticola 5.15 TaxID=1005043 RepID=G2GX78_9ENTR|nr:hypothetical protein Rin_00003680 [Candidatus Regiella insecticola 5.15]